MTEPRDDERLDEVLRGAYRQPHPDDEAAARRALERVRRERRSQARGLRAWLEPRTLSLRPISGLALALVLLGAGAFLGVRWADRGAARRPDGAAVPGGTEAPAASSAEVTFVLRAPGASRVTVAGDFNGWDAEATPLARASSGDIWTVRVVVPQGVHYYSFVLDGAEWRPDPSAPLAPAAVVGVQNSVLVVNGKGSS